MPLVLIVVDQPDTLLRLQGDLERCGHQTVLAADADTALERLSALDIDLVVLDVMMPVGDGWVVLEALQNRIPAVPALVMAGRARARDLDRASRFGAAGILDPDMKGGALHDAVCDALAGAGGWDHGRLRAVPSKRRIP